MADDKKFLSDIQSADADVRFAAWRGAGEMSPAVIPELGKLAASDNPGVAKAALEALSTLTHSVGKETGGEKRRAVVKELLALVNPPAATAVRRHACRLLSNIAGEDSVAAVAKLLADADMREEAAFCLERIPGNASIRALIDAYPDAAEDFKPRILHALGHRRAADAVNLCTEAMGSSNPEIAIAGARAFGRIGKKPASDPPHADPSGLSEWQKIDQMDSMLRYADAQVQEGNMAEAMPIYEAALDRPEEHWQCAAVIGIAKMGTPEAAAALLRKLESDNQTVRITARKAWKSIAAPKG